MNHKFFIALSVAGLLAVGRANAQDDTNAPPVNDYKSFQVISLHNIFSPSRLPSRPNTVSTTRVQRTDTFTLVGTMSYEKGQFAFFDGNSSSYRKTIPVGQTIAGYKVSEITPDFVTLAANSNQTINLPVGTQMRRPEGGLWTVAGRAEPTPDTPLATTPDGTPAAPGAAPALPAGGESDAMKRMMLKRLQEK